MIEMTEMSVAKAWDYAIGLIKVDGLEPTEDFKKYIEESRYKEETTTRFQAMVYSALAQQLISTSKAATLLGVSINNIRKNATTL